MVPAEEQFTNTTAAEEGTETVSTPAIGMGFPISLLLPLVSNSLSLWMDGSQGATAAEHWSGTTSEDTRMGPVARLDGCSRKQTAAEMLERVTDP